MKFARLRQPAMAALAVLLISGAGIAFASGSGTPAPPASAPTPAPVVAATTPAPVVVAATPAPAQSTEPVEPAASDQPGAAEPVDPAGTDTDNVQEGDQTAPDVSGSVGADESGSETPGTEADGPGGHADAVGVDVNHEFQGEE